MALTLSVAVTYVHIDFSDKAGAEITYIFYTFVRKYL